MPANRREFLKQAAAAAVAGASPTTAGSQSAAMPTPRAAALMSAFNLKFPIFNAGMGGFAGPELAIAVSNAGGFGAIGTGPAMAADVVRERVRLVKAGTNRPFAINYLLAFEPVTLSDRARGWSTGRSICLGLSSPECGRGDPEGEREDGHPDLERRRRSPRPRPRGGLSDLSGYRSGRSRPGAERAVRHAARGGRGSEERSGARGGRDRQRRAYSTGPARRRVGRARRYAVHRDQGSPGARRLQGGAELARRRAIRSCRFAFRTAGRTRPDERSAARTVDMWEAAGCPAPGSAPARAKC